MRFHFPPPAHTRHLGGGGFIVQAVGAGSGVMISNKPLIIGYRSTWGGEAPFVIHPEDGRFHTYIIGKTGSGKTTLLRNLILQHIHQGQGIAIIDPHGDLAEDLLDHLSTTARSISILGTWIATISWPSAELVQTLRCRLKFHAKLQVNGSGLTASRRLPSQLLPKWFAESCVP